MENEQQHPSLLQRAFRPATLWWFLQLNVGLLLTAAGIHFFKTPNHFAFGGTSGLSIMMAELFPGSSVGRFMFIVNAVLVIAGLIGLGVKSMGITIYSSFALSAYVALCETLYPMTAPFTDDTFLELCFAVVLPAVGSAIVFNLGASTGGTDILAMILAKYTTLQIGRALLVSDFVLVLAAGFVFDIPVLLYCMLGLFSKAFVVDGMIESINTRKQITIITEHPDPIKDFILHDLHRSATVHPAYGAYTGEEITMLLTVLTRRQAVLLRNFLRTADPHAFITIVNSSEVIGKGFRNIQ